MPVASFWGQNAAAITTSTDGTAAELFAFDLLATETAEFTVSVCVESIVDNDIRCAISIEDAGAVVLEKAITDQSDITLGLQTFECADLSYKVTAAADTQIKASLAGQATGQSQVNAGGATFTYKIWGDGYTPISN